MNEFSQLVDTVAQIIRGDDSGFTVLKSFGTQPRKNPQSQPFAVVGIKKISMQPLGLKNYGGGLDTPLGRMVQAELKVLFCADSGERCWEVWEQAAGRIIFSGRMKVDCIECGEAVWQKELGAVALPVKLSCEFIMSGGEEERIDPKTVRVIRKGER